jgi:hypothetical protein
MGRAFGRTGRRGAALALLLSLLLCHSAAGDVTTERGSSILLFPKLVFTQEDLSTHPLYVSKLWTGSVDTIIQISNTSNNLVFAHCFYVNASPTDLSRPPGPDNPPLWQEIDFPIILTKQQPTYWQIGPGRPYVPTDPICTSKFSECTNAGFDPGLIPPVSDPFTGELKCFEVDSTGAPLNGNHLKGEATIVNVSPDQMYKDASKYNALGILGLNTDLNSNDGDTRLCLGGGVTEVCPLGAEYNGCPGAVVMTHFAEGSANPVLTGLGENETTVATELTIVPCSQDFENQVPASVTVQFRVTNEFEELYSASTTVTCWGNFPLSDINPIFTERFLGTRFAQTRMTSPDEQPGFVGVMEEFHFRGDPIEARGRAALNLHDEGVRANGDTILLPEGP